MRTHDRRLTQRFVLSADRVSAACANERLHVQLGAQPALPLCGHASCAPLDAREGTMSFHVVRRERANIFVVNRQTYETYRFTIGDDVAVAHIGPPCDLSEARRTAIAFLAQSERKAPRS
jgi:hypothetical protein